MTLAASGGARPDEAWDRYADLGRWSQWAPQINRVEATDDRLAPGLAGRVVGPFGAYLDFVVDGVDETARRWSWTVRRGPLRLRLEHSVTKRGGGSATSLRLDGPLPVVVAYAPVARLALRRLVARD